jgi:thioredoxin reductase (NADPH)
MSDSKVIIIGAGPAGLSCALYLKRAGVDPLLLEKGAPGGKLLNLAEVANYPGFTPTDGFTLAQAFLAGAESQGVKVTPAEIVSVALKDGRFELQSRNETYHADAVVVASGLANVPSIPGEKEHLQKGVSYCATCDGPLFRKKDVALYGAGEKAYEEGLYLSALVHRLYFLSPDQFGEATPLSQELFARANVEKYPEAKILQIRGQSAVESIFFEQNGQQKEVGVAAIFPLLGEKSASAFLSPLNLMLDRGFIPVDSSMMSSCPGLFACGDIVKKNLRQVVTAASDGALASQGVLNYLRAKGVK